MKRSFTETGIPLIPIGRGRRDCTRAADKRIICKVMMRELVLSDDLKVFSLNADETRFVHREVFGERCYCSTEFNSMMAIACLMWAPILGCRHCSFIASANECASLRIRAEPAVFECLKANVELYGVDAHLFECGLSVSPALRSLRFIPPILCDPDSTSIWKPTGKQRRPT